jgi:hypothetical protein
MIKSQSKLHLFTSYHSASLAPGQLLRKEIPPSSVFTYEFECSPVVCDGFLLKSIAEYNIWRNGSRSPSMWFSTSYNETAIATYYHYLYEYLTDPVVGPVFAIDNPYYNQQSVNVIYNYRFDFKGPQNLPIILGVVLGVVGCCICCLAIFLFFLILWICRRKKEYLPVFAGMEEF